MAVNRVVDGDVRQRLIDSAAALLAEHGPDALSTRKVAQGAGISPMGVYTQFGSIAGLVNAVIEQGFAELGARMGAVPVTDDPIADLSELTAAWIRFARDSVNLYQVMFGTLPLGQYTRKTPDELRTGREATLGLVVSACRRGIEAGRLSPGEPFLLAHQWWSTVHGYTMLEIAGFLRPSGAVNKVLEPTLITLFTGLGDSAASARHSSAAALAPLTQG